MSWFSTLLKFKGTNGYICSSKKGTDGHTMAWCDYRDMKILPLDIPNQVLIESKVLHDHVLTTLEHFIQTRE